MEKTIPVIQKKRKSDVITVEETPERSSPPKRRVGRPPKPGGETPARSYRLEPELLQRINRYRIKTWQDDPLKDPLSESDAVKSLLDIALKQNKL